VAQFGSHLAFTRDSFTLKIFCTSRILRVPPPLYYPHCCNTIARQLCNVLSSPNPPFVCHRVNPFNRIGLRVRRVTKLRLEMVWGSFLIAAAALKTATRNGYNAQGVNLTWLNLVLGLTRPLCNARSSLTPLLYATHHTQLALAISSKALDLWSVCRPSPWVVSPCQKINRPHTHPHDSRTNPV